MIYIITIIEFVLGALMHFAYNVFSNPIVAVIAPVNESIFEHLKLVLYPMLFVSLLVWYRYKNKDLSFLNFPYILKKTEGFSVLHHSPCLVLQ